MKHGLATIVGVALALGTLATASHIDAKGPSMVDAAAQLYKKANPESFDKACKGPKAKLEVDGERHKCTTPEGTKIVEFEGNAPKKATVSKKGIHKDVIGQGDAEVRQGRLGQDDGAAQDALLVHR